MNTAALYHVPTGSRLILDGPAWLVTGQEEHGYAVEGVEDGDCLTLTFERVDSAIKDRSCEVIKPKDAEKRHALLHYTGGRELIEQLSKEQQEVIRFRFRSCSRWMRWRQKEGRSPIASIDAGGRLRKVLLRKAAEIPQRRRFRRPSAGEAGSRPGFTCPKDEL